MTFLAIVGLLVWTAYQQSRLGTLRDRLQRLELQIIRLTAAANAAEPVPTTTPSIVAEAPVELGQTAEPERPLEPEAISEPGPWSEPQTPIGPGAAKSATSRPLAAWLAENGLAWLGGGALALGGIFLVAYAGARSAPLIASMASGSPCKIDNASSPSEMKPSIAAAAGKSMNP